MGMLILLVLTACADPAPVSDTEDREGYSVVISEQEEDAVPEGTETILDREMESGEGMQAETYYLGTDDRILAYIPDSIKGCEKGTVPMILNLHWTGGTPEEQISENGWLEVSEKEGFIMIAPFYGSYDSVYRHTDDFAAIVRDGIGALSGH